MLQCSKTVNFGTIPQIARLGTGGAIPAIFTNIAHMKH
jgi:hypothetical protein